MPFFQPRPVRARSDTTRGAMACPVLCFRLLFDSRCGPRLHRGPERIVVIRRSAA